MNKKKKITILVCTLFMVFSLGACGKTKEDEAVVTQQESSMQIESIDEKMTFEDMPAGETETDLILEKLVGEYEYVFDSGKGSLWKRNGTSCFEKRSTEKTLNLMEERL